MAYLASYLDRQKELIAALLSDARAGNDELEAADPDEVMLHGKEDLGEELGRAIGKFTTDFPAGSMHGSRTLAPFST